MRKESKFTDVHCSGSLILDIGLPKAATTTMQLHAVPLIPGYMDSQVNDFSIVLTATEK